MISNTCNMRDITNKEDIKELVDSFYEKVNKDDMLSPIFNDVAKVDWPKHLPTMYQFWGSMLLGTMDYKGQPFPKHAALPVTREHFDRWVELFVKTVDEHFAGNKAEEAKQRGAGVAMIFQTKMGLFN
jgi:hemoglobin